MQTVLIIVHLIIVLALVGVVLLQRSEGGGLGMGGGSSGGGGFMTGRGQASVLTRATAVLAGLFFATSLALAILAGIDRAPTSVIDTLPLSSAPEQPSAPGAPLPGPGVLEELDRMQGGAPAGPEVPQSR
ncbi:preprotein translocase subunit SecG [Salinarimonas rosea]|uniref:preprotein translocase subunit SecG n=1 Tax=Salinarimonas rosea TaxID=552063 RepID=UPI0003F69FE7|nr:preprotein translocase subunit SecG [Salinarimonas rosea]